MPPGAICGETAPDFTALLGQPRALPVVSAGGDQQCAALGLGVTRACALSINCGTGAYVAAQAENPVLDPRKDVICNCSALPGAYMLEASTMASGMVYDWFVHAVCQSTDYQSADAGAAASPPGAGGVLALPDLMGRGMPVWDGAARGVFYNIGFHTTRGDLARAVLEGLAAGLCACVELMRAAGVDPAESRVAVVTNDFHMARSELIAARQGYGDVAGVPAPLPWAHLTVNYYLREAFALVKTFLFD